MSDGNASIVQLMPDQLKELGKLFGYDLFSLPGRRRYTAAVHGGVGGNA